MLSAPTTAAAKPPTGRLLVDPCRALCEIGGCTIQQAALSRHVRADAMLLLTCYPPLHFYIIANCKCKLDTRMNKNCSAQAGLDYHTASTAGAVKDAAGKAEPVP